MYLDYHISRKMLDLTEEIRDGYLISEKQKMIWDIELRILKQIKNICKKYDLKYFACSGTLLGAVRHHGFIPWDDDMDIAIPRHDFDKFIKYAKKELKSDEYSLQFAEHVGDYFEGFARIRFNNSTAIIKKDKGRKINQGIFVDIFPLDNIADNYLLRFFQLKKIKLYSSLIYYKVYSQEANKKSIKRIVKLIPSNMWNYIWSQYIHACKMCDGKKTKFVGTISYAPYNQKSYWDASNIEASVTLEFEDTTIEAPLNYENCLKNEYGNYMEFPPENERGNWHQNIFFDPYRSYLTYIESEER